MEILEQYETVTTYPTTPTGLSTAAAAIAPAVIWDRLYSYIGHRWGTNLVSWRLQGCGEFIPRLTPYTVEDVFYWSNSGWVLTPLQAGPVGIELPAFNIWKIDATTGGGVMAVPAAVARAYVLLAEYMASTSKNPAGVASLTSGQLSMRFSRDHAARALQQSGAADLLRPYRNLGVN